MNFRTQASLNMFIVHISFDNPFPYWPVKIAVHIYVLHHAAILFCYWNWLSLGSKKYVSVYHTLQNESLVESTVKRALGGWLMYIEEDWKYFLQAVSWADLKIETLWELFIATFKFPLDNIPLPLCAKFHLIATSWTENYFDSWHLIKEDLHHRVSLFANFFFPFLFHFHFTFPFPYISISLSLICSYLDWLAGLSANFDRWFLQKQQRNDKWWWWLRGRNIYY